MFGWKRKKQAAPKEPLSNAQIAEEGLARLHNDTMGHVWHALSGMNPEQLMPLILRKVLEEGGSRPPWQWQAHGDEYIAMAWPADQPIRACVLVSGKVGQRLQPVAVFPLLEGVPNDFAVAEVFPHSKGGGGNVAVSVIKNENPMWFFDPFFARDEADLTPDVTQTFWISAVALGIRPALADDVLVDSGPEYEQYAKNWLAAHPEARESDIPPLKVNPAGRRYIQPGKFYGEYRVRSTITQIEKFQLAEMPIQLYYLSFPLMGRQPLRIPVYVSDYVRGDFEPDSGAEIEAYLWLQGRVIDLEAPASNA